MDRPLALEDFADKVGDRFAIAVDDRPAGAVAATLTEAEPLFPGRAPAGSRPPFSLVFVADHAPMLAQRIYRIEHAALGAMSIFLVPIGRGARGFSYQATFN